MTAVLTVEKIGRKKIEMLYRKQVARYKDYRQGAGRSLTALRLFDVSWHWSRAHGFGR